MVGFFSQGVPKVGDFLSDARREMLDLRQETGGRRQEIESGNYLIASTIRLLGPFYFEGFVLTGRGIWCC